jgi:hypothetical protein
METPRFFAISSTRFTIVFSDSFISFEKRSFRNPSVSLRREDAPIGLARIPLAIGDHGITLD